MAISKSLYRSYLVCPKQIHLQRYRPEEAQAGHSNGRDEEGREIGEAAKGYFPGVVDVRMFNEERSLDLGAMVEETKRQLAMGAPVIAEASFSTRELFCSVDLLRKVENGYEMYEVKGSTSIDDIHYHDAAFQKYVLDQCGIRVTAVYILHLNGDYIRHGELDLRSLFIPERIDGSQKFQEAYDSIVPNVLGLQRTLSSAAEPTTEWKPACKDCPFYAYCRRPLPCPCVLDLAGFRSKWKFANAGTITFQEVLTAAKKLNPRQKVQIEAELQGKDRIIDKAGLKAFLSQLTYPIYHLDFETVQFAIPPFDGVWPYAQTPTQYSLHIEQADGRLEHKEFLGEDMDPRRAIAEALVRDIGTKGSVLAYNMNFERSRIKELAALFPDLQDRLMDIHDRIVDLIVPFQSGHYYAKAMGGSNSIKAVLPALFPNDPELDYHALPLVHNGAEAMDAYPKMLQAEGAERQVMREGLLKYCCLDTLAMVKVLQRIKEACAD